MTSLSLMMIANISLSHFKQFEDQASALGLHISWTKTKVQNIGAGPSPQNLLINGQDVESVEQFTYLGSVLNSSSGSRSEQVRQIGIAATTMQNLAQIWKVTALRLTTKLRLYMTLVIPVLLYASDTWTLTKVYTSLLQAFHMRCQRQILGVRWFDKKTNASVTQRTGLPHIGKLIQHRRYSLFGHVVRMDSRAPCHRIMKLCRDITAKRRVPSGWKRPRGRPCTTWLSQIRQDNGLPITTSWTRAGDRVLWRADARALPSNATG